MKGGDEIVGSRVEGGIGVRMSVWLRVVSTSSGVWEWVMVGRREWVGCMVYWCSSDILFVDSNR